MRPYSEAVKADVRRRMSPPHRQSVKEIAQELGIHVITLYKWRKAWRLQGGARSPKCFHTQYNSCYEQFFPHVAIHTVSKIDH